MSLGKHSAFYYGFIITSINQNFPFSEGSGEINARVAIGSYSLDEFVIELTKALNAAAVARTFSVSVNRQTRRITISANGTFQILIQTGSTIGSSCFDLAGFTGGTNLVGNSVYTGASGAGFEYLPQFTLQDYIDKENFVEANEASVNISASGDVEVLRFGLNKFYQMNVRFITNQQTDGKVLLNNPTGLQDAQAFLRSVTRRVRFEFMPDSANRNVFDKVILESIPGNSTATGFKLKEQFSDGLPGFFETGIFTLRVIPFI